MRTLLLVPLWAMLLCAETRSSFSTTILPQSQSPSVSIPSIDPNSYLPRTRSGLTVTISLTKVVIGDSRKPASALAQSTQRLNAARQSSAANQDLGSLINAANEELTNLGGGTILIEGGGSIKSQVTLKHHTSFDGSTYACDITGITDAGCFLVGDNVLVKGTWQMPNTLLDYFKNGNGRNPNDPYLRAVQALSPSQLAGTGTTILEPTFANGTVPAVEVFQALGDSCCSHTERAHDIAVVGFHIKGRQRIYDGGVRSTILLGNCTHCTAQNNYLEDTASIGITFGGSALQKNYFANDGLAWHNVTSGVAAANIAGINSENLYVTENYAFRLGHHEPRFGGGVCGFDLETNSAADHSRNIFVFNNLYDYEGSLESAGSGICLQDPYTGANHGLVVAANNIIIGGRDDRIHRFMSNGLFLNGLKGCRIVNNYVFRTGQNAIQGYALRDCLIENNDLESTGGGGNASVWTEGAVNSIFRGNNYRDRPGLGINTQAGFVEKCGQNNVYDNNLVNGKNVPAVARIACQ